MTRSSDHPRRWGTYLAVALAVHALGAHLWLAPSTLPILPGDQRMSVTFHTATRGAAPARAETPDQTPDVEDVESTTVAFRPRPEKRTPSPPMPSPSPPPPATSRLDSPSPPVEARQTPENAPENTGSDTAESTVADWEETLAQVVREAHYRKRTRIVYPRRALELGQQGTVTLHAFINPDGLPEKMKIVVSSGYSLLDKAALAAVRTWQFHPARRHGRAIDSWVRVPVQFVIQ